MEHKIPLTEGGEPIHLLLPDKEVKAKCQVKVLLHKGLIEHTSIARSCPVVHRKKAESDILHRLPAQKPGVISDKSYPQGYKERSIKRW